MKGAMSPQQLSLTIRRLRKRANLTQKQLADKAAVSQSYVSQLEKGRSEEPSVYVVQRIAKVLDVSIEELL